MDKQEKTWRYRGYIPHVDQQCLLQFITFHTADSLAKAALTKIEYELQILHNELSLKYKKNIDTLIKIERIEKIERYLDMGYGTCHLHNSTVAEIVQNTILHFDKKRYHLVSWCIMPNHVHVLLKTSPEYSLAEILHSWKSFSSNKINSLLDLKDRFWQREYFDRFIRNQKHLNDVIKYIESNPVKAGLVQQPREWEFSSAYYIIAGWKPAVQRLGTPASCRQITETTTSHE